MKSVLPTPVPFPLSFQASILRLDTGICSALQTHLSIAELSTSTSSTLCLLHGGSQKPTEMLHTFCSFLRLFGTDGRQAALSSVCDFTEKEWYESQLQPDFQDFLGCYPCSACSVCCSACSAPAPCLLFEVHEFRAGGTGAEQAELLFRLCCSAPVPRLFPVSSACDHLRYVKTSLHVRPQSSAKLLTRMQRELHSTERNTTQ